MSRLERLRREVQLRGWDALWIAKPANRQYLTGFTGSAGWVLIPGKRVRGTRRSALLITDSRYTEQAKQESRGVRIIVSHKSPLQCLAEKLEKWGVEHLGFEDAQVTVQEWQRLLNLKKGVSGHIASGLVEKARVVKEQVEITALRRAVKIAEQAYAKVIQEIKIGMSEWEIAFRLEKAMLEAGGEAVAFPTIVASGPRSSLPHANPTRRRLKAGDLVIIDFGCKYKGYNSDLTRTVVVAKMSSRQRDMYKIVKKAQKSAQKMLISGTKTAEADKKARKIFYESGLEKYFIHSLGHGIGLEVHESPRLSLLSSACLAEGMTVTCEPGVYLPGWGGIRIEDDVLVGRESARWLSISPEELPIVGSGRPLRRI